MSTRITRQVKVYGIVQSVGFRPTVSRHAATAGITGRVCNKGPYVQIDVQGTEEEVAGFLHLLEHEPPQRASILKVDVKPVEDAPVYQSFDIVESEKVTGEIFVSPDIAICEECKAELFDPENRRYLHPFINCTCCGPRLTILDSMPYDRERTSMSEFPLCPSCAHEYTDPASRRFDAQPVCCNECGPEVYLVGRDERGHAAIEQARRTIAGGGVAAIKGIGGFHLCCDATDQDAVMRLRMLKHRPAKPFAVMMRDMDAVRRECTLDSAQAEALDNHQKPILLLDRREDGSLCEAVAPDNPRVGVMLPYAPIQLLIFSYDDGIDMPDCLVMTSGNVSGAPICRDDEEAAREIAGFCDCMLSHDRKIRIRSDDSVMDWHDGAPYMIRRSRGYAPLPTMLSQGFAGEVLAVGGELKNTFCVGKNDLFYPSPYVGDMEDIRTVNALKETITRMETLLEVRPTVVACDLHPRYNTRMVAEEMGLPVVYVQHHYAHIVSCMAENDCAGPVLGLSMDGTGYGTDQTIWGGELLLADYHGFERLGHISPFLQVGGDKSAKEGWRIAVSMLYGMCGDVDETVRYAIELGLCDERTCRIQVQMADKHLNAVTSTSAGRLFDAVSAVLGIRRMSTYESEASVALQFTAEAARAKAEKRFCGEIPAASGDTAAGPAASGNQADGTILMDTAALFERIVRLALDGIDAGEAAWYFHAALAHQAAEACVDARAATGVNTVALSGGVFQNRLFLELVSDELSSRGFDLLVHSLIPPNDGGISLGQAVVAMVQANGSAHRPG